MTYNPAGGKTYTLGASISSTATSITLSSFTLPVSGTPITMAILDTDIAYGTIGPKTSSAEFISFTGVTQNPNGTATLTGVVRGLDKVSPFTTNATYKLPHSGQTLFILSDAPQVFYEYAAKRSANTFGPVQEFTLLPTSSGGNAISGNQLVTYAQALAMASGTTNIDRIVVAGNGGETITAGQLVYLLVTDGEWYKCDADTAATVDNIILGIAQGAGSNGVAITSGVLLFGLDSNQTGLTTNTAYYASNTAGAISSTVGTVEVSVGISRSTTSLLFYPRYNQQLTEDQQDALVGTSGTPSASNRYVTNADTSGTGAILRASAAIAATDVQAFTTAGGFTWTKPAGAKWVEVTVIGGGGAGGSGTPLNNPSGGGGGGWGYKRFDASALGATEGVTVGAAGVAGANNTAGGAGGFSSFGTTVLLRADGGNGGSGSGPATGGAANGDINFTGGSSGTGGAGTGVNITNSPAPRGGGNGGYNGGSPATATAGGAGGGFTTYYVLAGGAGGAAGVNNGVAGNSPSTGYLQGGTGGGGGGYNGNGTNTGGNGGAGAFPGGGGGGSVGTNNVGGNGARGMVYVVTYF